MKESLSFYSVVNLEKGCPRRNLFRIQGIKGVSQYYQNRKIFEQNQIYEFLIDYFNLMREEGMFQEIDKSFIERFENEGVKQLIDNFDSLIQQYNIILTKVNHLIQHSFSNSSVEIYVDGIGSFEGKNTIFKFNTTTRFNRLDALELVCSESALRTSENDIQRLIVLLLGSGNVREILKDGERTKSGALDKRGLPPWKELRKEANQLLQEGYHIIEQIDKNPDSFNLPEFGSCGTCPYHNIEVEYKGQKFLCSG